MRIESLQRRIESLERNMERVYEHLAKLGLKVPLPDDPEPSLEALRGIAPDATGGMASVAFVRKIRERRERDFMAGWDAGFGWTYRSKDKDEAFEAYLKEEVNNE